VKALRLSQGLSVEKAAKQIGCHPNTLRNWEQGSTQPPLPRAGDIANALGIPVAALFTDEVVFEVVVSQDTLKRCKTEGRSAAAETAKRLAAGLEPLIYDAATRKLASTKPGARAKPRRTRAERLAELNARAKAVKDASLRTIS
jgi:transcriptional regulator with XRE-family HTH domain